MEKGRRVLVDMMPTESFYYRLLKSEIITKLIKHSHLVRVSLMFCCIVQGLLSAGVRYLPKSPLPHWVSQPIETTLTPHLKGFAFMVRPIC